MPAGALLALQHKVAPTLSELSEAMRAERTPARWPPYLATRWRQLRGGIFWHALARGLSCAPQLGIRDGSEVCLALAAVAQTLLTADHATRSANQALARKYRAVLPSPQPPIEPSTWFDAVRDRPDERGVRLETDELILTHASHRGPKSAGKSENQDATGAATVGSHLVFALGDGVSTSLGARAAACLAVARTCAVLQDRLPSEVDDAQLLVDAAKEAQRALDDLLGDLIENPDPAVTGSELPAQSAARILQNTRTAANKHLPSALSTTLIAGIVKAAAGTDGRCQASILRIGDGVVEHVRGGTEVTLVFDMDHTTTEIREAIGPGARSLASLDPSVMLRSMTLQPGDVLLVSSDGLVRGHGGTVWSLVEQCNGGKDWMSIGARGVLEWAARAADETPHDDSHSILFDDNLSLVMVGPKPR